MKKAIACMTILLLVCMPVLGSAGNFLIEQFEEQINNLFYDMPLNYYLSCNETGVVLIIWRDGVSRTVMKYMDGSSTSRAVYDMWVESCNITEYLVIALRDLMYEYGLHALQLTFVEVDEYTHTVPFFIMHNKDVVYNCIPKPL